MSVFYTGTKLHYLVTEDQGCEQLAQRSYAAVAKQK